jgi:hypothetical protein
MKKYFYLAKRDLYSDNLMDLELVSVDANSPEEIELLPDFYSWLIRDNKPIKDGYVLPEKTKK